MQQTEFSEYSIKEMNLNFGNQNSMPAGCIGTCEEALDVKILTKKCKGVVTKKKTKHSGGGELKITGHMLLEAYYTMHGMKNADLAEGVMSFGSGSMPSMCITMVVLDEDDNVKLKAYPNSTVSSGPARKIDASSEEIAEVELTISLAADSNGNCLYEKIVDPTTDEELMTKWMTNFNYDLVEKKEVA